MSRTARSAEKYSRSARSMFDAHERFVCVRSVIVMVVLSSRVSFPRYELHGPCPETELVANWIVTRADVRVFGELSPWSRRQVWVARSWARSGRPAVALRVSFSFGVAQREQPRRHRARRGGRVRPQHPHQRAAPEGRRRGDHHRRCGARPRSWRRALHDVPPHTRPTRCLTSSDPATGSSASIGPAVSRVACRTSVNGRGDRGARRRPTSAADDRALRWRGGSLGAAPRVRRASRARFVPPGR